jgi:hypothetical protein
MIGDHHGRTAGGTTLLVRAVDGILGTHRRQTGSGPHRLHPNGIPATGAAATPYGYFTGW